MKITEKIFDVSTGEETILERDETPAEKKDRLDYETKVAKMLEEEKIKADQKAALLEKLGISEEEVKLLLG